MPKSTRVLSLCTLPLATLFLGACAVQGCTLKLFPWQKDEESETEKKGVARADADAEKKEAPHGSVPIYTKTTAAAQANAVLGAEVSLAVGESAQFTAENLELKLNAIPEDSRCPEGTVCVWEGQARFALSLAHRPDPQSEARSADLEVILRAGHPDQARKSALGFDVAVVRTEARDNRPQGVFLVKKSAP